MTEHQTAPDSTSDHNSSQLRQKDRETLERRMAHLEARIAEGEKIGRRGLDYDRGELAALRRLLAERG